MSVIKHINTLCHKVGIPYHLKRDTHPFTPEDIRKNDHAITFWSSLPYCGIKVEDRECAWRIEDIQSVDMSFCKPAKGPGNISLSVIAANDKSELILQSKSYSTEGYSFLNDVANMMTEIFETHIILNDYGFDA